MAAGSIIRDHVCPGSIATLCFLFFSLLSLSLSGLVIVCSEKPVKPLSSGSLLQVFLVFCLQTGPLYKFRVLAII